MSRSGGFNVLLAALTVAGMGSGCQQEPGPPPVVVEVAPSIEERIPGVVLPAGGESLFATGLDAHRRNGGPDGRFAEFSGVDAAGTGEVEAIRVRVADPLPEHPWYAQVATPVIQDLQAGDVLLLSFWARAVESAHDDGRAEFLIYLGTPGGEDTLPGTEVEPAVYRKVRVGPEWTQIVLPVKTGRDYEKIRTSLNLDLGFQVQTIDLAGIRLARYRDLKVEDLPSTGLAE